MTTLNITDLAARLDTDARTTRKFLRTITPLDDQPGKGSRWSIEARQVQSLKAKFRHFTADIEATKAAREAAANDTEGPTDADLEAIEADSDALIDA